MAEKNKEVQKVDPNLPDYLQGEAQQDDSLEGLKQHRILPRLKAVQGTSSSELKASFGEGDLIVRPGDMLVSSANQKTGSGDSFLFVPAGFFVEFCKWSDLTDNENPSILDRTFDETSDIAIRARNPERRFKVYEGQENKNKPQKARFVEHLNFICFIYSDDHPLKAEPFILDFSRGEFQTGKNFINKVSMRKAPLWSQVWEAHPSHRDRGPQKKWWGVDVDVPEEGSSFISKEEVEFFKNSHAEFKELIEQRRLVVDRTDQDEEQEAAPSTDEKEF